MIFVGVHAATPTVTDTRPRSSGVTVAQRVLLIQRPATQENPLLANQSGAKASSILIVIWGAAISVQLPKFRPLAQRGKSDNRLRANCLYPVMAALRGWAALAIIGFKFQRQR